MKKLVLIIVVAVFGMVNMQIYAQKEQGFLNRLAIGVSASTTGIGFDASTTFNRYFMLRAGLDFMPNVTINEEVEVDVARNTSYGDSYYSDVEVEGTIKRMQGSLLLNIYPFKRSSFFISGGAYFGGDDIVKVKGHSQELKDLYDQYGGQAGILIGDYKLPIDKNGNVAGSIRVSGVRPYVGLGMGRAVPHKRIGFMFEMGVQFHGTPKVYSSTGDLNEFISATDSDDDFSEIMEKLTVYPVIKFRLCGRIF